MTTYKTDNAKTLTALQPEQVGVMADDLTGACDVAAAMAQPGNAVTVWVKLTDQVVCDRGGYEVFNSQSRRRCSFEDQQIHVLARRWGEKKVIFKKIDSALRGPVGPELHSLTQELPQHAVVIAPALPDIGRVTRNGVQYDNGIPIDQTDYAQDPVFPIVSSRVADAFNNIRCSSLSIFDAEYNDDLNRIVQQGLQNEKVIFVGSLGLADALAAYLAPLENSTVSTPAPPCKRAMIVCGSKYPQAQKQLHEAVAAMSCDLLNIDPFAGQIEKVLPDGFHRSLLVNLNPGAGLSPRRTPEQCLDAFILRIMPIIDTLKPDGLGIIGGDTAYALLAACNTKRIGIEGRLAQVTAYGKIMDGLLAGCRLITKGGSVGSDQAVIDMLKFLQGIQE